MPQISLSGQTVNDYIVEESVEKDFSLWLKKTGCQKSEGGGGGGGLVSADRYLFQIKGSRGGG